MSDITLSSTRPVRSGRTTILPELTMDGGRLRLTIRSTDRYDEQVELGVGGVGEVIGAIDRDIGRRVAIKRLLPERQSASDVARFVREIRLVGALEHPNIVPLHDVGQDDDASVYAVMKWVQGETLDTIIARLRGGDPVAHARWDFDARTRVFMEICRGIAFANRRGVLHRDIKPANVMVGAHGEVQILDWGLAKAGDDDVPTLHDPLTQHGFHTQAGAVFGTPAYMAPEQARGEGYTAQTEVFALGMLFWEWLTLQSPGREHTDTQELLRLAQTRRLPWAAMAARHPAQGGVPAHLAWLVHHATEPDPAARYASVDDLMADLRDRASGVFPVQCPMTAQRRILALATRLLDRSPMVFGGVWMMGALGLAALLVAVGVLIGTTLG